MTRYFLLHIILSILPVCRSNLWSFDFRTWSLLKVRNHLFLRVCFLLVSYLAISDAVRTSLGPRGMDKMVLHASIFSDQSDSNIPLDSNFQRRSDHHERWCDYPQKHSSFASCRKNGKYSLAVLSVETNIYISSSTCPQPKISKPVMAQHPWSF